MNPSVNLASWKQDWDAACKQELHAQGLAKDGRPGLIAFAALVAQRELLLQLLEVHANIANHGNTDLAASLLFTVCNAARYVHGLEEVTWPTTPAPAVAVADPKPPLVPKAGMPDIEALACDRVEVHPVSNYTLAVTIDGFDADDFIACCADDMLKAIVLAAGEDFCDDVFSPEH